MLSASAQTYIFFPGGLGTLDEFFEMVTLIQTGKMSPVPIVCIGKHFWEPLDAWIKSSLTHEYKTVSPEDTDLYTIVNTAGEAFAIIKESKERKYF